MSQEMSAFSDMFDSSRTDRGVSLTALHEVERMAAAPGPLRTGSWRDDLLEALGELGSSLHEQYAHSDRTHGLLQMVVEESPHLLPAVEELATRQENVSEQVDLLTANLADLSRPVDVVTVREEIAEITLEIRELRAWETDIVYEAYAFDLGVGD